MIGRRLETWGTSEPAQSPLGLGCCFAPPDKNNPQAAGPPPILLREPAKVEPTYGPIAPTRPFSPSGKEAATDKMHGGQNCGRGSRPASPCNPPPAALPPPAAAMHYNVMHINMQSLQPNRKWTAGKRRKMIGASRPFRVALTLDSPRNR